MEAITIARLAITTAEALFGFYLKLREQNPGLDWSVIDAEVAASEAARDAAITRAKEKEGGTT